MILSVIDTQGGKYEEFHFSKCFFFQGRSIDYVPPLVSLFYRQNIVDLIRAHHSEDICIHHFRLYTIV